MYLNFWEDGPVVLIGWRELTEGREEEVETGGDKSGIGSVSFVFNEELEFNKWCEGSGASE